MRFQSTIGWFFVSMAEAGAAIAADAPVAAQQPATIAPQAVAKTDEASVRKIVDSFCDSWTKHDMTAMHAHVTPDVEWMNVVGNDWRGIDEVRKGHVNYHHFLAAKSTCAVESVSIRPVAADALVTVTVFHFAGFGPDGKPEDARTRSSMVMVKRAGDWKIFHMQNTIINPATQGPADPLNFDEKTGLPKGAR